tara:strand:+ start:851 stop:1267 length:417 start_codon:yes stop_codon:yes gene_type:complete
MSITTPTSSSRYLVDIQESQDEFHKVRASVLRYLNVKEINPKDFVFANSSDMNMTICRAMSVLVKVNSYLDTPLKRKVLFTQLTQVASNSSSFQKMVFDVFQDCLKRNTFSPDSLDDDFVCLTNANFEQEFLRLLTYF